MYKSTRQHRSGLSLMELVIVLAILAATATVATVATERILSQKRFELTQSTLAAVRSAVLGKHGPGESTAGQKSQIEGFVADMGRLPLLHEMDTEAGKELQPVELWQVPADVNLEPYDRKQAAVDPEVWISCGWRGPYLEMPVGRERLIDGWGRSFVLFSFDESGEPTNGEALAPLAGMTSYGSDGTAGETSGGPPLSTDLNLSLLEQGPQWMMDVTVMVWQEDEDGEQVAPYAAGTLTIRLFGPNPADGSVAAITAPTQTGPFVTPPQATFSDVPIGPKVIRAYFEDEDGNIHKTVAQPVEVTRGGQTTWSLVLPAFDTETALEPAEES